MRLSCTVMEIWRFKNNEVTLLTFCGHVTSSVLEVDFLSVVHGDHASIWHHYRDKCTKHQLIHLLTATLKNSHIENSKNHKRWYCPHRTDCVSMCCWI